MYVCGSNPYLMVIHTLPQQCVSYIPIFDPRHRPVFARTRSTQRQVGAERVYALFKQSKYSKLR